MRRECFEQPGVQVNGREAGAAPAVATVLWPRANQLIQLPDGLMTVEVLPAAGA
eukprot:CAMPEP_0185468380 /NCGR_PEP_ID=MMETSP1365-20130426/97703_1 /TAXON_ID=38817 /ORGANISM="Gephyrocapsa oceanica, Strain RCC1303" /LENGTH=53 /DNA_ID=CAMNT_0028075119 /DNA_START=1042 /DNA_END=1203 /DNA_ORIENTATION=+